MVPKLTSVFECPERFTQNCGRQISECLEASRMAVNTQLAVAEAAYDSVMDTYQELAAHTEGWKNQTAVNGLKMVFESLGNDRHKEAISTRRLVCSGKTFLTKKCSATTQTANF